MNRRRETAEEEFENLGRMARDWAQNRNGDRDDDRNGDRDGDGARDRELQTQALERGGAQPPEAPARHWLAIERSMQRHAQAVVRRRFAGASALVLTAVASLMVARGLHRQGGQQARQDPPAQQRDQQDRQDQNVSFVVSQGVSSAGGTVHPGQVPARLSFSDGSDVVLHPGARGTVIGTTRRGARVRLEEGRARFTVAHRAETDWSVEAGPFTVDVHGTVFDVVWSSQRDTFTIDLLLGSVTIEGPMTGGSVTLGAGQRLTARASTGEKRIDRIDAAGGAELGVGPSLGPGAPSVSSASPAGDIVGIGAAMAPATVSSPGRRLARSTTVVADVSASWSARVASGAFQSVVDEADATGVELCLAKAPADSLAALADAARYVRRTDLARRALLAERRRFAGSVGARDAAFLIGRLAEDTSGDLREALLWYDRYLEQDRRGTYSSEALGRKMLALDRLGEAADARVTAGRYLTEFPGGAFSTRARRIQSQLQSRAPSQRP